MLLEIEKLKLIIFNSWHKLVIIAFPYGQKCDHKEFTLV